MTDTTGTTNGSKIANAVKGELALGIQRIFVIIGIPILLGVGGFLGVRAVTTIDKLGERMDMAGTTTQLKLDALQKSIGEQGSTITVLQSAMALRSTRRDEQVGSINERVADHEGRIRMLERPGGLTGPR